VIAIATLPPSTDSGGWLIDQAHSRLAIPDTVLFIGNIPYVDKNYYPYQNIED